MIPSLQLNLFLFLFVFIFIGLFLYIISSRVGLIDRPSSRKLHKGNVPLIGGITIYLSILIFINFVNDDPLITNIFYISGIVLFMGMLDDIFELTVWIRLIGQFIVTLLAIGAGISIDSLGNYYYFGNINLYIFGTLLTFISIIGLTNAFNFIDGLDGLCGGQLLLSLIFICISIFLNESFVNLEIIYLVIYSIIIFLFFNFNFFLKFKIFLGDSGSTFLGFFIACLLIYYTSSENRFFHPVLTLWCIALPVFDMLNVIVLRLLNYKNPFSPDKNHLHYLLTNKGYKGHKVILIMHLLSIILFIIGILSYNLLGPDFSLLIYLLSFTIYYLYISQTLINNSNVDPI